jgi:hypothetical protein
MMHPLLLKFSTFHVTEKNERRDESSSPSHDCFCAYAAASRRSSLTTAAKASGLTPCSHKATRMASVWRSKPVPSTSDMRCTRSSDSLALARPSLLPLSRDLLFSRSLVCIALAVSKERRERTASDTYS